MFAAPLNSRTFLKVITKNSDKRIYNSLEDKSTLRLSKIEIRLENFLCFHIDTGIFIKLDTMRLVG